MKKLVAAVALVLFLSGCAQPEQPAQEESVSAEEQESAAAASLLETQMDYCEGLTETLTPYVDFTTATYAADPFDTGEWLNLSIALTGLDPTGFGDDWESDHAAYMSIHDQIEAAVSSGDGNITLTSTDYKAGMTALMERCVDIGYTTAD